MSLAPDRLAAIVDSLRSRPGHENVRGLVRELCVVGLGVADQDVNFEIHVPEVRGRIDALFGSTIFEFKRDLRRELGDAEDQLAKYLAERERATGNRFLGIATDGASFVAFQRINGRFARLDEHIVQQADPRGLLRWLDTAITVRADLPPDPETMRAEFGRDSLVFRRCTQELRELWELAKRIPEASLKKELWSRHLEFVYGTLIEPDELFLQHTYLTVVAKTLALRTLVTGPLPADDLLAGTPFVNSGLDGAVETDFFDWVRLVPPGRELVRRIAGQVERFRLSEIEVDVLKALYESLIDPAQRHYLGEYYTPDWLADWVCREAIPEPLNTRALDPACGSGTFLFHLVRRFLDAADANQVPLQEALERCTSQVLGIDVHPVAVLFARVTYLLAIGSQRLQRRTGKLSVPVYLGDALQWDVRQLLKEEEIEIAVPGEQPLLFPGTVAGNPTLLDSVLRTMRDMADQAGSVRAFQSWMAANTPLPEHDRQILAESYVKMRALHAAGRNHIWTYIVRNLTRPLWLSVSSAKPDVVIGNPPWLRFNAMSKRLQERFRQACKERGLWVGGRVATHQDLSAYFFVRCVERYLADGGRIAFVMPLASLGRAQYAGFRYGQYATPSGTVMATVRFERAWTFDSDVQPLFPVPSSVVFGRKASTRALLPKTVLAYRGQLLRRDATPDAARSALRGHEMPWPQIVDDGAFASVYRKRFKQGATVVPRRLLIVVPAATGPLGRDRSAPLVMSRVGAQDKKPWKNLAPLEGQIEQRFLRPIYFGESVAPFRALEPFTAVVPWDERSSTLMNSGRALDAGFPHVAQWLKRAEALWKKHGLGNMSFLEQMDYYGKLSSQFPIARLRVVYSKAGILPVAAIIRDEEAIIDHKLYWMATGVVDEARYLVGILNSEAVRGRIEGLQSEGQFGKRDFDKVMFSLPIPRFQRGNLLHQEIAQAAVHAEGVAARVQIEAEQSFQSKRRAIREALISDGVSRRLDVLITRLIGCENRALAAAE